LIGVYGAAIFTQRGSAITVPIAFVSGFMTILLLQPYILGEALGALLGWKIGFAWQLLIGSGLAFMVMMTGRELPKS